MPERAAPNQRRDLKILWAAGTLVILILSLLPRDMMILDPPFSDKIAHFMAYGAVTWLGAMAASTIKRLVYLGLAMLALGILLEFAQAFVPGRTPELFDGLANALGVISGLGLTSFLRRQP
jgi:VanZ family protein